VAVKVRLTRKYADTLNGIDLSNVHAGEEILLSQGDAEILIAEGWAAPIVEAHDRPAATPRGKRKISAPRERRPAPPTRRR
jgi:hypothetical protein